MPPLTSLHRLDWITFKETYPISGRESIPCRQRYAVVSSGGGCGLGEEVGTRGQRQSGTTDVRADQRSRGLAVQPLDRVHDEPVLGIGSPVPLLLASLRPGTAVVLRGVPETLSTKLVKRGNLALAKHR